MSEAKGEAAAENGPDPGPTPKAEQQQPQKEQQPQQEQQPAGKQTAQEDYGYVFFSKRNEVGTQEERDSFFGQAREIFSLAPFMHRRCLKNVVRCAQEDPFVKLMLAALKSRGCPVDLSRHISCEPCIGPVNGGFDFVNKQVAVCENNCRSRKVVCHVLRHELIHAFDYCRAKVDLLDNLDHIACTEVRAANFVHCSYSAAFFQGLVPSNRVSDTHRQCVRAKALGSVLGVRNVSREMAEAAVDRVFERCYADLEPAGMRPKKGTFLADCRRAFQDAKYYGYVDSDDKID